jgi:hypothetical protein
MDDGRIVLSLEVVVGYLKITSHWFPVELEENHNISL